MFASVTTFYFIYLAPSSSPLSVSVATINSTSVNVSWSPPLAINQNGLILMYDVSYQGHIPDNRSATLQYQVITPSYPDSTRRYYVITNLEEYVMYTIIVTAINSNGTSPPSYPFDVTTNESGKWVIVLIAGIITPIYV